MKNETPKQSHLLAHFEMIMGFSIILLLITFSVTRAQILPNLPVEGQAPYQIPRTDAGVVSKMNDLMENGYSLQDNLSWNPMDNMRAVYNYANWNLRGTCSEQIKGQDYVFNTLADGVQAQTANSGFNITLEKYNQGAVDLNVIRTHEDGDREQYAHLSNGGAFVSFTPKEGDSFARNQEPDGRYSVSIIDSAEGVARISEFDSRGEKTGERYEYPPEKQADGLTVQVSATPSPADKDLYDKTYHYTDASGKFLGTATITNLYGGGRKEEFDYPEENTVEYYDSAGKLTQSQNLRTIFSEDEKDQKITEREKDPEYGVPSDEFRGNTPYGADTDFASNDSTRMDRIEKLASKIAATVPSQNTGSDNDQPSEIQNESWLPPENNQPTIHNESWTSPGSIPSESSDNLQSWAGEQNSQSADSDQDNNFSFRDFKDWAGDQYDFTQGLLINNPYSVNNTTNSFSSDNNPIDTHPGTNEENIIKNIDLFNQGGQLSLPDFDDPPAQFISNDMPSFMPAPDLDFNMPSYNPDTQEYDIDNGDDFQDFNNFDNDSLYDNYYNDDSAINNYDNGGYESIDYGGDGYEFFDDGGDYFDSGVDL